MKHQTNCVTLLISVVQSRDFYKAYGSRNALFPSRLRQKRPEFSGVPQHALALLVPLQYSRPLLGDHALRL